MLMDEPLNPVLRDDCGPPPIEKWTQLCREASNDELFRLRLLALDCPGADGAESQRWSLYFAIAQEILRERGIKV
jgi:hypothetical protein